MSVVFFMCFLILIFIDQGFFIEFFLTDVSYMTIEFVMFVDWKSLLFMSFVCFISSMVLKYSEEYMLGDTNLDRFVLLKVLFVFSMMFMILGYNLISILLGWDGLGLVSYALVIYYQNVKSYNAGMITALSNRVGDAALLMAILWMIGCGSWNLDFYQDSGIFGLSLVAVFVILAGMTKSAQIPFSSWLPAAMAAPTPVSSLVHSSTLVTAGVYLFIRSFSLFSYECLFFLLFISLLTMFMSGLCANFEYDLKKIIALSTLSQLGMMISILCLGDPDLTLFHLLIHALFKALLFMCAGMIIHSLNNCQDIRYMGGLVNYMPLTMTCFNISNFALCGLPFMSGFYSKDLIAEVLSMQGLSLMMYLLFYLSIGLTVSYSMRLSYFVLWGEFNFSSLMSFKDGSSSVAKSMLGLIFLVVFMGSFLSWVMFSWPYFIVLPFFLKLMTLLLILIGGLVGAKLQDVFYFYKLNSLRLYLSTLFFSGMWNMPLLTTLGYPLYFLRLGKVYYKIFDHGWFELYGKTGLMYLISNMAKYFQFLFLNKFVALLFVVFMYLVITLIVLLVF
uniref:NADH-ubiquinone oxidoreductase chain 5 n=1 Tax=Hypothenemus sp. BMNH 1039866 TaxID=1903766 RepID=A0A343A5P2_9CUCU|nr:NADH dehydrogenase subunit 5 [Hypothenemus sp. BMNH 1039866]